MSAQRAMRLDDLLRGIAEVPRGGEIVVSGLTQDSRAVRAGDAFVALHGARAHGIAFASMAFERGAVAVLAEKAENGRREMTRPLSGLKTSAPTSAKLPRAFLIARPKRWR